jgi:hypothetical protein
LRKWDEGKEGEEDENGLFHSFISWVEETGRKPAASKGEGALRNRAESLPAVNLLLPEGEFPRFL